MCENNENNIEEQDALETLCLVCEQNVESGCVELRGADWIESGPGLPLCPFCGVGFDTVTPAVVPTLSDLETIGAWHLFVDQLTQWNCNVMPIYRGHKFDLEPLLDGALSLWALGSVHDGDVQYKALLELWPVLAYGRVFQRLETALLLTDRLSLCTDAAEIRAAVARPDVCRVWHLWLDAHEVWGLDKENGEVSNWHRAGTNHISHTAAFGVPCG